MCGTASTAICLKSGALWAERHPKAAVPLARATHFDQLYAAGSLTRLALILVQVAPGGAGPEGIPPVCAERRAAGGLLLLGARGCLWRRPGAPVEHAVRAVTLCDQADCAGNCR